jgi:hypothetical protein
VEFTEYGVRYSWSGGMHVTEYGRDRAGAVRDAKARPFDGQSIELVRRRVSVSEWTTGAVCPRVPAVDSSWLEFEADS